MSGKGDFTESGRSLMPGKLPDSTRMAPAKAPGSGRCIHSLNCPSPVIGLATAPGPEEADSRPTANYSATFLLGESC